MSKTLINTIIVLLLASALVLGYLYLGGGEQTEQIGLTTSPVEGGDSLIGDSTLVDSESNANLETDKQFVELLAALESANLGVTIFEDPVFANGFTNFQKPLPVVPSGRANPFAPLPGQVITGTRR